MINTCPACRSSNLRALYRHDHAPVHSVLVHHTREEALCLASGQIVLAFCKQCGFIFNQAFDPALQDYSLEYESTQGYSPTFNQFATQLASNLVERYDLHGKDIIEIGCGQGEFLKTLCEMGGNRGLGFDPAYVPGRVPLAENGQLRFIRDYYSEQYAGHRADFIVCKMTLEHIQPVRQFVETVRRSLAGNPGTTVYFQIPDVTRILDEGAFWDVYYEHCSYFSPHSLRQLFTSSGFDVLSLWRGYGNQYLMIEAKPTAPGRQPADGEAEGLDHAREQAELFARRAPEKIAGWQHRLQSFKQDGKRVALWGGGSKAVSFLTTLGDSASAVERAVDINPFKNGTFLAGSGTEVTLPDSLKSYRPDIVIIMNPIYRDEIRRQLAGINLFPELMTVND